MTRIAAGGLQSHFYQRALQATGWKDRDLRQEISFRWEMDDRETFDDLRKALTKTLWGQAIRLEVRMP